MRHLLVSSEDETLVERLRTVLPADSVLFSARGVDDTLERLQGFAELAQSALSQPPVIETVPTRSDALPPNIAGLGDGSGAS